MRSRGISMCSSWRENGRLPDRPRMGHGNHVYFHGRCMMGNWGLLVVGSISVASLVVSWIVLIIQARVDDRLNFLRDRMYRLELDMIQPVEDQDEEVL